MRVFLILSTLTAFLISCASNRDINQSSAVNTLDYEPMYKKDRRLEEYSKLRTNSHGSAWPGNGGSFASSSYRQSAIEGKDDNVPDPINQTIENPGYDDLAADTADEGRSW